MEELQDSQDNFWISYADLMAGLLFVFILVIGAIIVKHNYMTAEFTKQKKSIEKLEEKAKKKEAAAEKLKREMLQQKKLMEELTLQAKQRNEKFEQKNETKSVKKKKKQSFTEQQNNKDQKHLLLRCFLYSRIGLYGYLK